MTTTYELVGIEAILYRKDALISAKLALDADQQFLLPVFGGGRTMVDWAEPQLLQPESQRIRHQVVFKLLEDVLVVKFRFVGTLKGDYPSQIAFEFDQIDMDAIIDLEPLRDALLERLRALPLEVYSNWTRAHFLALFCFSAWTYDGYEYESQCAFTRLIEQSEIDLLAQGDVK